MKVLIQNKSTGLFLSDSIQWITNADNARSFEHALDAFRFCRDNQIRNTKIVLRFENSTYTAVAEC